MKLGSKIVNHLFALSIRKNGKRIRWIASGCTPFILKVEQYSKNRVMWPIRSSYGRPLNYEFWIIWIMASLISKLFAATASLTIRFWSPWTFRLIKSRMVLWTFCLFCLCWATCCLGGKFLSSSPPLILLVYCLLLLRTVFSSSKSSAINETPCFLTLRVVCM